MKIVFWQPLLNHLQSAHIRALASRVGVEVTIVGLEGISAYPYRKSLGWGMADFGNATTVESPSPAEIADLVYRAGTEAIHLLAGWRGLRYGKRVLGEIRTVGARHGLLAEGADLRGWQSGVRRAIYWKDRIVRGSAIDFIIAMGEQGVAWFRSVGYPESRLFSYGYITETPPVPALAGKRSGPVEILYLGQCIARKGMDIALRALAHIQGHPWRLAIIGSGPLADEWRLLADSLGIADRVRFLPALPYVEAQAQLADVDLLLLPSRFDGWGAVVNESLMAGVPVICSDRCGAKDLLKEPWRGEVFQCGSVASLRDALERWIAKDRRTAEELARIRGWASCLDGSPAADYLLKVFAHVYEGAERPLPPWTAASVLPFT